MPEITEKRLKDMADDWNYETSDPETQEWRDDLTPEEARIVRDWDNGYAVGMHNLCRDIMALYQEGEHHG